MFNIQAVNGYWNVNAGAGFQLAKVAALSQYMPKITQLRHYLRLDNF